MGLVEEERIEEEQKLYVASQWQLMRWRFLRHKMAVVGLIILGIFYFLVVFAEFMSPYDPFDFDKDFTQAPPQKLHFIDEQGRFHLIPFAHPIEKKMDPQTYLFTFTEDKSIKYPLRFFIRGDPYKFWGLFEADLHFFGVKGGKYFILGADPSGRDMLSRLIYGSRISLSVGLIGISISFILGLVLGGISGYYSGRTDIIIQRVIESVRSIPTLPLWMALSVALPPYWTILQTYFAITIILSIVGWTEIARVVRGKFMSLREEDFVTAAKLDGASETGIVIKYLLPSFLSHIIAAMTLAIPGMILGETALSFLGLGMQAPAISWGVLLREAQRIRVLAEAPWILIPAIFVALSILAFNFVGDGLRDAADPYARI